MDRAYTKNANKTKKKCVHTNSEEVYRKEAVRLTRATRPTSPHNPYNHYNSDYDWKLSPYKAFVSDKPNRCTYTSGEQVVRKESGP